MAAFSFGAEVSAHLTIGADLMGYDGTDFNGPKMTVKDQKDTDALIFDFAGEKAGAHFQGWYTYNGDDKLDPTNKDDDGNLVGPYLRVRSANIWFKPIDMLKISVGNIGNTTFTEQINWWHGLSAANMYWYWSNVASVDGFGVMVDVNVGNLSINAGITPGLDPMFSSKSGAGYGAYGIAAKYKIMDGLSAAISWNDAGKDAAKMLKVGADYSNGGLYAFENVIFRIEGDKAAGLGFDTYVAYSVDALKIQAQIPVTIRLAGEDWDPSYMMADVKVSYGLGAATLYCQATTNTIAFKDGYKFAMDLKPGVSFNVGECSIDVQVAANIADSFTFSVPVTFGVSL